MRFLRLQILAECFQHPWLQKVLLAQQFRGLLRQYLFLLHPRLALLPLLSHLLHHLPQIDPYLMKTLM